MPLLCIYIFVCRIDVVLFCVSNIIKRNKIHSQTVWLKPQPKPNWTASIFHSFIASTSEQYARLQDYTIYIYGTFLLLSSQFEYVSRIFRIFWLISPLMVVASSWLQNVRTFWFSPKCISLFHILIYSCTYYYHHHWNSNEIHTHTFNRISFSRSSPPLSLWQRVKRRMYFRHFNVSFCVWSFAMAIYACIKPILGYL